MSLSRAFTTRRAKGGDLADSLKIPLRSNTLHKATSHQTMRQKISGPVELVHTTNMLSYNAPDVPRQHSSSQSSSTRTTEDESDVVESTESTPPTSPDGETHDSPAVEPNHLSCYFMAPGASTKTSEAPAIPKRAPSHTKKTSVDAVARNRSVSRLSKESDNSNSSLTFSRSSSTSTRASSASQVSTPQTLKQTPPPIPQKAPTTTSSPQKPAQKLSTKPSSNPFGLELAQVTELAEEFSTVGKLDIIYEDEQYLSSRGLVKASADDYLGEVQAVMTSFWPGDSHPKSSTPMWI